MSQSKIMRNGNVANNPTEWYRNHAEDYQKVLERLGRARRMLLQGPLEDAARALRLSYINAVMSIRTEKERHERAFTAYVAGDKSLKDAFLDTVYGGQKADWAKRTMDKTDWESAVMAIRAHWRAGRTVEIVGMADKFVGVSYTKWSFTLAMLGVWEFACIDSNLKNYMNLDERLHDSVTPTEYVDIVHAVRDTVNAPIPPFLAQWCIYDFERGEHARHMPFYREVLNA